MASSTVENYLKQIFVIQQRRVGHLVSMGTIAKAVGVTPGTATGMIKALADSGLVEYTPRGGVRLSPSGEQLALHVLRRHRLIELFLVNVIGLDWSEVHEEAEELDLREPHLGRELTCAGTRSGLKLAVGARSFARFGGPNAASIFFLRRMRR